MPVVTMREAVDLLTHEVQEKLSPEELFEVIEELLPEDALTQDEVEDDPLRAVGVIVDHLESGLPAEEIADIWRLIAPRHHQIWYDEEADRIHYNEDRAHQTAE